MTASHPVSPIDPARPVGFSEIAAPASAEMPAVPMLLWYPTQGTPRPVSLGPYVQTVVPDGHVAGTGLPLVLFSHGTGGWAGGCWDSALALARAGFVVAAISHPGDNHLDQTLSFTRANFAVRPGHLRRALDVLLTDWAGAAALAGGRVGVFGYSAGGATALLALGGVLDWEAVIAFARAHPEDWGSREARRRGVPDPAGPEALAPVRAPADPRIKAAVLAAPALTAAFTADSLAALGVPISLWTGGQDGIVPEAPALAGRLPGLTGHHHLAAAGHFSFLAPCTAALAAELPEICADAPGFDRAAFLLAFQAELCAFFGRHLA